MEDSSQASVCSIYVILVLLLCSLGVLVFLSYAWYSHIVFSILSSLYNIFSFKYKLSLLIQKNWWLDFIFFSSFLFFSLDGVCLGLPFVSNQYKWKQQSSLHILLTGFLHYFLCNSPYSLTLFGVRISWYVVIFKWFGAEFACLLPVFCCFLADWDVEVPSVCRDTPNSNCRSIKNMKAEMKQGEDCPKITRLGHWFHNVIF